MNKILCSILTLSVTFLFISCASDDRQKGGSGRSIPFRDSTLTDSNAYNPVFLDSMAMEAFIKDQHLDDTLADGIRGFYNVRNYQFAWIAGDGLTEQALSFKSLFDFENGDSVSGRKLDAQLDDLATSERITNPNAHLNTELMFTWRFVNYADRTYSDETDRNVFIEQFLPVRKMTPGERLDYIKNEKNSSVASSAYTKLKSKLLSLTDSLSASPDSLKQDSLNGVIEKILLNLERMRWMPDPQNGHYILVNIPEFMLHVRNGAEKVFDMNVVVGKEANNTILFSSRLNHVVFSPYWNLPRSIVKNEVLPAMEKNKNYLTDNNMEITGEQNGLPVVRQLPGPKNSLGKVKFLFPNGFNIYFHDTPNKTSFNKEKRAFSHGCVRLGEPKKMAEYLLRDNNEWTSEKIEQAMNSGTEKWVKVKDPVPVMITYYTAWVDENDSLRLAEDIYGHDKKMAAKLFTSTYSYAQD
ncbi:MAG TPA: L,D-transpeptidase family protein [Parasegetibacter sp.]